LPLLLASLLGVGACQPEGGSTGDGTPASQAPAPRSFDPARSDPEAVRIADRVMTALGGADAWAATRFIYFTFAVRQGEEEIARRTHLWDKVSGLHRVEGLDREGRAYVIIHPVGAPAVLLASIDSEPITEVEKLIELKRQARELWINDTYWLLMPYKLKDPGVILAHEGEESEGEEKWDVVRLSFDQVGMTPGDRYWIHVNQETGLVDRWAFVLQNMEPDAEPAVVKWTNWRRYGQVMLSDTRTTVGGTRQVVFPDLAVFDALPETVFTSAAPMTLPGL
jgi:hypothetical protein